MIADSVKAEYSDTVKVMLIPAEINSAGLLPKRIAVWVGQRNSRTGTLQERTISVVVEPMIRLRMRECP